jgi:CheY-like chemotaxis protein
MHKARVLVVDDQLSILELDRYVLESEGYQVMLTQTGRHALELLRSGYRPDVIVCDLVMQEMDGLQLLQQLKADPRFRSTPVIACSGHPHLSREAFEAGATDFFRKPFTSRALVELVDRHCAASAAEGASSP